MSKKRKIILICVAVTLALVLGVGGVAQAFLGVGHEVVAGHRLLGVGWCDSYCAEEMGVWRGEQHFDTMFIVTNPNCDRYITIDRMFILDENENLRYDSDLEGPTIPSELSPHEIWEFYLSEYVEPSETEGWWQPPQHMDKYTVEIIWDGEAYGWWWRARVSPLAGWMKQFLKTEHYNYVADACMCVPDPDNPCREDGSGCTGTCQRASDSPGVKCIPGTCVCSNPTAGTCECVSDEGPPPIYTCPGWVPYYSDIEMSESQMVYYQPVRTFSFGAID